MIPINHKCKCWNALERKWQCRNSASELFNTYYQNAVFGSLACGLSSLTRGIHFQRRKEVPTLTLLLF